MLCGVDHIDTTSRRREETAVATPARPAWTIRPDTDLSEHARALRRVHDAVLSGHRPVERPRPVVQRSWSRVLAVGLIPDRSNERNQVGFDALEQRRRTSPLRHVINDLFSVIETLANVSAVLLVVTDADGVILWRRGASAVQRQADTLGFTDGALWTEEMVGTNAIGTALAEAAPVQLFSAEHFEQAQHPWYCTAHPIHDPRTGDLLGIVDVSGPALTLHPTVAALVETSVRLAEAQLWRRHTERLERLRHSAEQLAAISGSPLLVVDDRGWVAYAAGVAARDRIAVPRADTALGVPGLGLCLPERLSDGWLIRPATAEQTIRATLHLAGPPTLEVCGGHDSWRVPLTARHAQILTLLHRAGPTGLTASALSQALYGDDQHLVTTRAEVSRLRRAVGALVATQPYRLADGVRLAVLEPTLG
jgi:hypothetical protein